jgi:hypothetical protein
MIKTTLIFLLAIVAVVTVYVALRPHHEMSVRVRPPAFFATNQDRSPLSFAKDSDGAVRVIYAVVEPDGIYFGDQRVDFAAAIGFLDAEAKKEHIRAVYVCITDAARYGDAARFYIGIDKARYYVTSFPTIPVAIGYRFPLTGEFRVAGDSWFDASTRMEIW